MLRAEICGIDCDAPPVQKETIMTNTNLSPTTQKVVDQIRALREYTARTGFRTTRSQNEVLQTLEGVDLADALLALN